MGDEKERETTGDVIAEIRDLLKALVPGVEIPGVPGVLAEVVARPKATDWKYNSATTTTTEMTDVVVVKPKTGYKLNPTCVVVRAAKASTIDVCLTPISAADNEIIAPGAAPDNGVFIHWFPYGIYIIGESGGATKFWVRAQGVLEIGLVEAVLFWEESK